ncbi:hypothetical protein [Methyloligella solikamskensis]|uniref:HEAT repeat domain-containing protein n=1 Tax=Methyloligella solikamskensis TaxID=1177756 RepID=A0ABW3JAY3_9HYPH
MTNDLENALQQLEAGLSPPDYDALVTAFQGLEIPGDVDSKSLKRIYDLCFRILGIAPDSPPLDFQGNMEVWQAGHLQACAASTIEESLYDRNAHTRQWIREMEERYEARGKPVPGDLNDDQLPPELHVPWDVETAKREIAPFLAAYERNLTIDPGAHFKLCYDVATHGYPVFRKVFDDWMDNLEARGLGQPGMRVAVEKAEELEILADKADPVSWEQCAAEILPLIDDPHPMVAAGAARYLGALFADESFPEDEAAPSLAAFITSLSRRPALRRALCGGFVRGFDTGSYGLGSLAADERLKEFDLDEWVIEVLSLDEDELYLPNVQAFWFHVHEFYDGDPGFITRLIDMDRSWIAMMCATERPERVEGMEPVLHRLAENPDPEIAAHAESHLARFYQH